MSWEDAPTGTQLHRIARFALALGIREPIEENIQTRAQARDILNDLYFQLKQRNKQKQNNRKILPGRRI
ncbi:MAG: hypothetical protein A9183_07270 [Dehalococcoides mccartyi]|uniref:hypothetical protein n=1 Tax=Dehalococcoides mccartyi TaxID=61435 RepID=UPI0008055376|nr:hypothetical protein [Dehalococcoides mccartyi]OBW63513.1 MAG: hypothetical protein A9183_07270 [Dehalococcoides mccartyi]